VLVLVPVLSEKVPLLVLEKTPPKAQRNPCRLKKGKAPRRSVIADLNESVA